MPDEVCSICGGEIAAPPKPDSEIKYLRGESGCLIVADLEYPLHKCPALSKAEATELLQTADIELPEEFDL